jgi:hypothetical protein
LSAGQCGHTVEIDVQGSGEENCERVGFQCVRLGLGPSPCTQRVRAVRRVRPGPVGGLCSMQH